MTRPRPRFKKGDRVVVPCFLMTNHREVTMCEGTIERAPRWEDYEGREPAGWFYGVNLDVGGGTASSERRIRHLDVITELGDLVRQEAAR